MVLSRFSRYAEEKTGMRDAAYSQNNVKTEVFKTVQSRHSVFGTPAKSVNR